MKKRELDAIFSRIMFDVEMILDYANKIKVLRRDQERELLAYLKMIGFHASSLVGEIILFFSLKALSEGGENERGKTKS